MSTLPVSQIRAVYAPDTGGDILLYAGALQLSMEETTFVAAGDLVLCLGARPALHARFAGREPWMFESVAGDNPKVALGTGVDLTAHGSSVVAPRPPDKSWCEFEVPLTIFEGGDLSKVNRLRIHLAGRLVAPVYLDTVETDNGDQDQLRFELPGWSLAMAHAEQPTAGFSYIVDALPERPPVTSSDVAHLLRRLVRLMSFVAGSDVGIGPVAGLDSSGEVVWLQCGPPRVRRSKGVQRWCWDGLVPKALPALAVGLGKLADPGLEACIDRAIGLWLAANGDEVLDVKIPIACSGLELLSWSVLQHRQWLTPETLKKLTASEQVRLLLQWATIPTDIPAQAPVLAKRVKRRGKPGWAGPEAVFEVCNRLTHPPTVLANPEWPDNDELFEAWQLANWYLELVILRLLSYSGEYTSRLHLRGWVGTTESVPWA